jgi:GTP-binding protein
MPQEHPKAAFVASAGQPTQFPPSQCMEYCVVGRSNVGKSSFVSHVFGVAGLARVSRKPGKTITANFYRLDDGTCWVDLPGYGYAKLSQAERTRVASLMDGYFGGRAQLRGVIWLLDARHPGLAADRETWRWLKAHARPVLAVLTKCDKLGSAELARAVHEHATCYDPDLTFVRYSVNDQRSRVGFWRVFRQWAATTGADARTNETAY